jgi:uncharacterized protein (DUF1786 family)
MSRYLMVDIGAGTMDILWFDLASGQHFKAVARSPVPQLADEIARIPGKLLVTGGEMGGERGGGDQAPTWARMAATTVSLEVAFTSSSRPSLR